MTQENNYQGPLSGLNVIDFGHYFAGPMVGMLLADQGANVISIVQSGQPELLSQHYRLLNNRKKKLLTLDLKNSEERSWKRLTSVPRFGEGSEEVLRKLRCLEKEIEELMHLRLVA